MIMLTPMTDHDYMGYAGATPMTGSDKPLIGTVYVGALCCDLIVSGQDEPALQIIGHDDEALVSYCWAAPRGLTEAMYAFLGRSLPNDITPAALTALGFEEILNG